MPRYLVRDGFMLGGQYGDVAIGDFIVLTEREAAPHVLNGRIVPAQEEQPTAPPAAKRSAKTTEAPTEKEKP